MADDANTQSDADFIAQRVANFNQGRGLVTPQTPPAPAQPSGFGQLMSGVGQAIWNRLPGTTEQPPTGFAAARENTASSPATAFLGQLGDYLSRSTRAQQAAAAPSLKDWLVNTFAGDTASTEALKQRAADAATLKDPLTQSYLTSHPDQLAIAERDPRGYAAVSTDPGFRERMAQAVGNHIDAAANPKVTHDEHPYVVQTATNNNITADAAHAMTAPRKYTRDEFIKATEGMPTATFMQMFGAQLQHVRTPQEKAASELFDRLHGDYATKNAAVEKMEAEIRESTKKRETSPHLGGTFLGMGTSPYDAAKAERDKAYNATTEALRQFLGLTGKAIPMPGEKG